MRNEIGVLPGLGERPPGRLDDAGARSGEIGADIGGAGFGAAKDNTVGTGKRRPATGAATINAKHEIHHGISSHRYNTNKIPVAKTQLTLGKINLVYPCK